MQTPTISWTVDGVALRVAGDCRVAALLPRAVDSERRTNNKTVSAAKGILPHRSGFVH
jgi:hypothetical protein